MEASRTNHPSLDKLLAMTASTPREPAMIHNQPLAPGWGWPNSDHIEFSWKQSERGSSMWMLPAATGNDSPESRPLSWNLPPSFAPLCFPLSPLSRKQPAVKLHLPELCGVESRESQPWQVREASLDRRSGAQVQRGLWALQRCPQWILLVPHQDEVITLDSSLQPRTVS